MWTGIADLQWTPYEFRRQLIDNVMPHGPRDFKAADVVKFADRWWCVVNGRYGHCMTYPREFLVKLFEVEEPSSDV